MNEGTPPGASAPAPDSQTKPLGDVIAINEGLIKDHLNKVVVKTVEETLNAMLDAEADQLCGARRYEHSPDRVDTRAGHYERQLHTKAGEVTLKMPKLRKLPFETAIIERYQRREISVEEALVEMYLAGVSVRRVEDITQALWGTRVSPSTVSELNQKIAVQIEEWRNRPLTGQHPYVFLDGIWLKRSWGGEVKNVSILVAIGVDQDGYREVLGVMEGAKEDKASWVNFMRHLKERGLAGVRLFKIDWKLYTDLPVGSRREAIEKLRWYALRWKIELFHKILKSGCKVEESRLRTAARLVNLIATCCVLGWRIFWMTMVKRSNPDAAPTLALTQLELDLLDRLAPTRSTVEPSAQNLASYLVRIARLGGYLDRANDPPPGNIVMWRGLARLTDIAIGYSLQGEKCG